MPRKMHLYIFLNEKDHDLIDISKNVVFTYVNRLIIEEDAQIEIIELNTYQDNSIKLDHHRFNSTLIFLHNFTYILYTNSYNTFDPTESICGRLQQALVNSFEKASCLEDGETENHFIFDICDKVKSKSLLALIRKCKMSIRLTFLGGYRHHLSLRAQPSANLPLSDTWMSKISRHLEKWFISEAYNLYRPCVLGDDIEQFFYEMQLVKKDLSQKTEHVAYLHAHQMLKNDEIRQLKLGDSAFTQTLFDTRIPHFGLNERLFVEVWCARFSYNVLSYPFQPSYFQTFCVNLSTVFSFAFMFLDICFGFSKILARYFRSKLFNRTLR